MAKDIKSLRKRIDEIDDQLLKLYEERMDVVRDIGAYKMENALPVYDAKREDEKIDAVFAAVKNKEYADGAAQLFITLMQASRELQEEMMGLSDSDFDDFNWDGEPVEIKLEALGAFGEDEK
ncbi:MAG: chorismate mutase [Lachnospiraceae bacterium]|nr:chorismate mutase [Lachnospiraceae bacterium]MBR2530099.1 chorismate mutase [Lachnospiraceae bacterium]